MARILVIDDDPDLLEWVALTLKSAGHEVLLVADGNDAVKQHQAYPAELVITDLQMPNQDGLETIRQLRKSDPGIPLIAMTGQAPSNMLSLAQHQAAIGLLLKPFVAAELVAAVDKALAGGSTQS
jgi:DNA-binding NtrC family response regulator